MQQELVSKRFQRSTSNQSAKSSSAASQDQFSSPLQDHTKLASRYWKKYDGFLSAQELTVADGIRLLSFDYLFRRCYQYHLTHHTFHPNDQYQIQSQTGGVEPESCVFEIQTFKFGVHGTSTKLMRASDLDSIDASSFDVVWINILQLSVFPQIIEKFKIDSLVVSYFYDLRPHSISVTSDNGTFLALSSVQVVDVFVTLVKLYTYTTKNLLITFERELLPEKDPVKATNVLESEQVNFHWLQEHLESQSIDSSRSQLSSLRAVLDSKSRDKISEMGSKYLLYEIALHSHILSSSVLELFSRNLSHLPQAVTLRNPSSRHKRLTYRRVCVQGVAIDNLQLITQRQLDGVNSLLSTFQESESEGKRYFLHLIDGLQYRLDCLTNLKNQLNHLNDVMTQIHALCTESTSKNLNLIATMFLPLTFFAGVFGMNFQENGGYCTPLRYSLLIEVVQDLVEGKVLFSLVGAEYEGGSGYLLGSLWTGLIHLEFDNKTTFGFTLLSDDFATEEVTTRQSLLRMKTELDERQEQIRQSVAESELK